MKKMFLLTIVAMFALAGSAFAAGDGTSSAGQTINGGTAVNSENTLIGNLSTGVSLGWNTTATNYAISTQHTNGSQQYGTADNSTSLYRTTAADTFVKPTKTDSSAFSSWTEL